MASVRKKTKASVKEQGVLVTKPRLPKVMIPICGTAPYVQKAFSKDVMEGLLRDQLEEGAKKKPKNEPRDLDKEYEDAMHRSAKGWVGIPAAAFRSACIRACSLTRMPMTKAKMSVFINADGFDVVDGTALVRIYGDPVPVRHVVRIGKSKDTAYVVVRPMWYEWSAKVRVTYDADQFSDKDIGNLMLRAGMQVGIGEGRPYSKNSDGMGWGTFEIKE